MKAITILAAALFLGLLLLAGCGKQGGGDGAKTMTPLMTCEANCNKPKNCYCRYKNGSSCMQNHVLLGECTCVCE